MTASAAGDVESITAFSDATGVALVLRPAADKPRPRIVDDAKFSRSFLPHEPGQALTGAGLTELEEAVLGLDSLQTLNAFHVLSGARTPADALV